MVMNLPAMQETRVQYLSQEDSPGVGNGYPLQYSFLPEFHGQRSLAGYSARGGQESNRTERLTLSLLQYCFCFMLCFLAPWPMGASSLPGIEPTVLHWKAKS